MTPMLRYFQIPIEISVFNDFSEESNKKHPFPCPTTYRTALTHYLDITHPPRTNVLYELAQYASDPKDQENMRKMASSSPEGKVSDGLIGKDGEKPQSET